MKLVLQTTLPVLPAITRQPALVRGQGHSSSHQRLVVDHDELALVRPTVPLQEDSGALVAQPVAAKLAAAAPEAQPVDTSPTVVKFPALAVLLMVSVLPVIPVAELPDTATAGGCEHCDPNGLYST